MSLTDEADILGRHFDGVSSCSYYTEAFLRQKREAERKLLIPRLIHRHHTIFYFALKNLHVFFTNPNLLHLAQITFFAL